MSDDVVHGYMSVDDLQNAIGDTTFGHIPEHIRAINAASRQIDMWTGRYFYQDDSPSARPLNCSDRTCVPTGDFDDASTVIVKTDDDDDGVFETVWTSDQWQAQSDSVPSMPFVRFNGWPWTSVTTATRGLEFPVSGRRASIEVTAVWGWAAVPGPIEQACEALATLYYRSKDSAGVTIGFNDNIETLSTDPISVARSLVKDYVVPGGTLYVPPVTDLDMVMAKAKAQTRKRMR